MIYLDNAATTLHKPPEVAAAVVSAMSELGNAGRGAYGASLDGARTIYRVRALLAEFFGAGDPRRIVFTCNSTESLNIALKGLLKPGDHAITTQLEHNSVLRPLYELQKQGVGLTIVQADRLGRVDYADFERAITPQTRLIAATHASNLTGNMLDIARIGEIAHRHGLLLVVDASQTAGEVPVDAGQLQADVLCFTGHKGLMGPQGTGGMYVRPGVEIRPLLSGGTGVQSYLKTQPPQMPERLEAGTLNGHGIAGLGAAVRFIMDTGIGKVQAKEQSLMRRFYEGVRGIPGVTVYGDFEAKLRCPIVALNIRGRDSGEVSDALFTEYGIAVRPGAHCAPLMHEALGTKEQGAVRFSFSYYNTKEETDAAIRAVRALAREEET